MTWITALAPAPPWRAAVAASDVASDLAAAVALGIFGTLVAAITFASALNAEASPRWPTVLRILHRTWVLAWMVGGLGVIAIATLASSAVPSLRGVSLALSIALAAAGLGVLLRVLATTEGPARERIVASELRRRWKRGSGAAAPPTRDPFLDSFRTSIESGDFGRVDETVGALVAAVKRPPANPSAAMRTLTDSLLECGSGAAEGSLPGSLASPALSHIVGAILQLSGPLADSEEGPQDQRRAAVLLGQISRELARHSLSVMRKYDATIRAGLPASHLEDLLVAYANARRAIREAVDPDPPATYIVASAPWARGLSDPTAVLLWYWGYVQDMGHKHGMGQFALYEVLTGRKFLGSYAQGKSVMAALDDVIGGPEESERLRATRRELAEIAAPPADLLSGGGRIEVGSFRVSVLELFALAIAGYRPAAWRLPENETLDWDYSVRPEHLRLRLRLFTDLDVFAAADTSAIRRVLAELLLRGGAGPAAGLTGQAIAMYQETHRGLRSPLPGPGTNPAAVVLAVLFMLGVHRGRLAIEEVVDRLSDDVCRATLATLRWKFEPNPADPISIDDAWTDVKNVVGADARAEIADRVEALSV